MTAASSGELGEILRTHTENMERAGVCASRHKAVMDRWEALREEIEASQN